MNISLIIAAYTLVQLCRHRQTAQHPEHLSSTYNQLSIFTAGKQKAIYTIYGGAGFCFYSCRRRYQNASWSEQSNTLDRYWIKSKQALESTDQEATRAEHIHACTCVMPLQKLRILDEQERFAVLASGRLSIACYAWWVSMCIQLLYV